MSFGPYLTLLDRITWKKLQKGAKNGIMKKNISEKKRKNADFFSGMSHKSSKNHRKNKIFVPHNVSCSQNHRKKFSWSLGQYSWNEIQIPEKKPIPEEIQVRLESLPIIIISIEAVNEMFCLLHNYRPYTFTICL